MVKTQQKIEQDVSSKKMPSTSTSTSKSKSSSSPAASAAACKKMKKYKGVRMRSWGSWVSEIRAPNQKTRIWLGSYSTAEAAARAYDAALICLKGSSANLNFPITSSHYIPDTVMSPKSIQRVAAAAAAAAAANNFVNDNIIDSNATTTDATTPPISPPLPSSSYLSSSSSSSISSPSSSSSPSDQVDDDVSLMHALGSYSEPISMMEPLSWYNFDGIQSPKYVDQMFLSFDQPLPMIDDFLEDGDIRLWNFC